MNWVEFKNQDNYINLDKVGNVSDSKKNTYKIHLEFVRKRIKDSNLEMLIHNKKLFTQDYLYLILFNLVNKEELENAIKCHNIYGKDLRSDEELYLDLLLNELQELQFLLFNSDLKRNESSVHNKVVKKSNNLTDFINNDENVYIEFQNTIQYNKRHITLKSLKYKHLLEEYKDKSCYILQQKINREDNTCLYKCIKLQEIKIGKEQEFALFKSSFDVLNDGNWMTIQEIKESTNNFEKYV